MKRVKEAFLILAIAVLLLLVVEAGVRLAAPQRVEMQMLAGGSLAVADSSVGHRNRPGAVAVQRGPEFTARYEIDDEGLRGRAERVDAGVPGEVRLLLLGDSFTFGIGNDADVIWSAVLERTLRARGYRVRVLNAGVPGYDTRHAVRLLERDAARLRPDLVALVFLPHDLFTNTADSSGEAFLRPGEDVVAMDEAKTPVLHVVTLLQRLLLRNDRLYAEVYRRTGRAALFEPPPPGALPDRFDATAALLRRAHAFCRDRAVPFVAVSLPQQFQVLVAARGYRVGSVDVGVVDRRLAEEAAQAGFPWIATLDTLAAVYRRDRVDLYYRFDGHLTERGHRVVGRYLADRLDPVLRGRERAVEERADQHHSRP